MRFRSQVLALLCAVWIAMLPSLALAQSAATQGNDSNPTATGGIRILGADGTNDYKMYIDANGYQHQVVEPGVSQIIQHWTAKTIGLGFADSSVAGFQTTGYSKVFVLIRFRQASTATVLQLGWKHSQSANFDTTNTWNEALGAGDRGAMTIPASYVATALQSPNRMMRFQVVDSLNTTQKVPMTVSMPWGGIYVKVVAGATCVIDLWLELVK